MTRNVFFTRPYEGWAGFLEVPSELDLKSAFQEYKSTHFHNTVNNEEYSDEWWDVHFAQENVLREQGIDGWDAETLFLGWLCKNKGCTEHVLETYCIDMNEQNEVTP